MNRKIILICGLVAFVVAAIYVLSSEMADHKRLGLSEATAAPLYYSGQNVVVIKPVITEATYGRNGFYWYYEGRCDMACLTVPIQRGEIERWGAYNIKTMYFLEQYNWPVISDAELHYLVSSDADYLRQYDAVILLHSEYVTRQIYDAILDHPNVIYLMPNALYAEVAITNQTVTLIRGHGYPEHSVFNGFGWKHDNTPEEYDLDCADWEFRSIDNGWQLNCYPERDFIERPEIMQKVVELIKKPN